MKAAESVRSIQRGNNTAWERQPNSSNFYEDSRLTMERKSDAGVCVDEDYSESMLLLLQRFGEGPAAR